jgi:hypothetical protein
MIVATDRDDQVASRPVVADSLQDGAAVDVAAFEGCKIDGLAAADLDRLGDDRGGEELREQDCDGPDHGG